ncbi:hypothetical protein TBLA_0A05350 [Henningerozyma blattae CBS 6284]|uniref:Post-GPI attachment to proteins factor 3 n=1 Tax=Henningerozyma blattae (strain ATCC 34711 / CBS 6284 / DSM 70876 / NBRC 10599 / NRRL Y-10934 / UCD 77-7) TaxID=1071380 RepID=I2GW26_HENB6|nr:hypothetical protein TBLA_0A05350 [Tetrapisispora blattae CBS 6284]CCH58328.1 hypothetical protein TBLA_0A05350 [Tetrapisispora blattae CBS 6284]
MRLQATLLIPLLLNSLTLASPGDNLDEFDDCLDACEFQRKCPNSEVDEEDLPSNSYTNINFNQTPFLLEKLLFWDCMADCDYQCQHIITKERIHDKEEIYQFHGKWPFLRLLGMQEFFSTIFSVGNFIPHYFGFRLLLQKYHQVSMRGDHKKPLLINYIAVAIAGMLAWISSSIFHFRDLLFTEKLDYFFAGGTVLMGFHAIIGRMFRLDHKPTIRKTFSIFVITIFCAHLLRLYLDWSYTYNMRFNLFFGLLQYASLVSLAIRNYLSLQKKKKQHSYGSRYNIHSQRLFSLCATPILLVVFTSIAMSMEIFDFFSYTFQIDSHAIWHAGTILPSFFLYKFFIDDYEYLSKEEYD